MKKQNTKLLAGLLSVAVTLSLGLASSMTAFAAGKYETAVESISYGGQTVSLASAIQGNDESGYTANVTFDVPKGFNGNNVGQDDISYKLSSGLSGVERTSETWQSSATSGVYAITLLQAAKGDGVATTITVQVTFAVEPDLDDEDLSDSDEADENITDSAKDVSKNAAYKAGGAVPAKLVAKAKSLNNASLSTQITVTAPSANGELKLKVGTQYAGMSVKFYMQSGDNSIKLAAKTTITSDGSMLVKGITQANSYVLVVY